MCMEYITDDADEAELGAGGGGGAVRVKKSRSRTARPYRSQEPQPGTRQPPMGDLSQEIFYQKNFYAYVYFQGMTVYMTNSDPDRAGEGVPVAHVDSRFFLSPVP